MRISGVLLQTALTNSKEYIITGGAKVLRGYLLLCCFSGLLVRFRCFKTLISLANDLQALYRSERMQLFRYNMCDLVLYELTIMSTSEPESTNTNSTANFRSTLFNLLGSDPYIWKVGFYSKKFVGNDH